MQQNQVRLLTDKFDILTAVDWFDNDMTVDTGHAACIVANAPIGHDKNAIVNKIVPRKNLVSMRFRSNNFRSYMMSSRDGILFIGRSREIVFDVTAYGARLGSFIEHFYKFGCSESFN